MLFAKVGNRPDAEDLTADVFLAALRPLRISASAAEVRAYLLATAALALAALAGFAASRTRVCCIEPKGVLATAQSSKAGSTIPVENYDNWASGPCRGASGRADKTSLSGPIAQCNRAPSSSELHKHPQTMATPR